jgi:hypothetical protein
MAIGQIDTERVELEPQISAQIKGAREAAAAPLEIRKDSIPPSARNGRTRSQGPNRRERKTSSRPCGMRVYAAICCKAPVNGMRRVPVSLTKVRSPRPRPRCPAPTFSHKLSRRQDTASRPYTSPFCSSVNLSALTCKKYKKHIASFPLRLFLQNILLAEFTWVMRLYANFVRRAEANRNKDVSEVT